MQNNFHVVSASKKGFPDGTERKKRILLQKTSQLRIKGACGARKLRRRDMGFLGGARKLKRVEIKTAK